MESLPLQLPIELIIMHCLLLPWVCLILGWTYLINDEKISAIGKYIRLTLIEKIKECISHHTEIESIFDWEIAQRNGRGHRRRKIEQLSTWA